MVFAVVVIIFSGSTSSTSIFHKFYSDVKPSIFYEIQEQLFSRTPISGCTSMQKKKKKQGGKIEESWLSAQKKHQQRQSLKQIFLRKILKQVFPGIPLGDFFRLNTVQTFKNLFLKRLIIYLLHHLLHPPNLHSPFDSIICFTNFLLTIFSTKFFQVPHIKYFKFFVALFICVGSGTDDLQQI